MKKALFFSLLMLFSGFLSAQFCQFPVNSDLDNVCPGQLSTLTVIGGIQWQWSDGVFGQTRQVTAGTYTVTVTNNLGCSASTVKTIGLINDNTPPSIICPSGQTVSADASCHAMLPNYTGLATATDNCTTNPAKTQFPFPGTSLNVGVNVVTLTATDASGFNGTCTFIVQVKDVTPPIVTCPSNQNIAAGPSCVGMLGSWSPSFVSDNCGAVQSIIQTPNSNTILSGHNDVELVTLTATDGAGNSASCNFNVTLKDVTPPNVTCPANVTLNSSPNSCGTVYAYNLCSDDNCTIQSVVMTGGLASGATFPVGQPTTVTYQATDLAGNTAICWFTVKVDDSQKPVITCPDDVTINSVLNQCGANAFFANATAIDNCGVTVTNLGSVSGTFFPVGTASVSFKATDGSGNSSTCSFTIIVKDTQVPTVNCPANITTNATVNCNATVNYSQPTGTDNCSVASITLLSGIQSGASFPVGVTPNVWQAKDVAGNVGICVFNVRVNGPKSISPVTANADGTYSVTITDLCTGETSQSNVFVDVNCQQGPLDSDGDGVPDAQDCQPFNAAVYPGAPEVCDGQDNNCNGQFDEGLGATWYQDLDGDNFGNPGVTITACQKPNGYVGIAGDCDDNNSQIHPGMTEFDNNIDDNCDGVTDEGFPTGGCMNLLITASPLPACAGDTVTLQVVAQNTDQNFLCTWSPAGYFISNIHQSVAQVIVPAGTTTFFVHCQHNNTLCIENAQVTITTNCFSPTDEPEGLSVSVFPNPTTGIITIDGLEVGTKVQLFAVTGQLVEEWNYGGSLDISERPAGIYFLQVGKQFSKIVKSN